MTSSQLVQRRSLANMSGVSRGFRRADSNRNPSGISGDEQHEFAALLALNTTFGLTRLSRKDFGGHR